jgi:hypothetical protein
MTIERRRERSIRNAGERYFVETKRAPGWRVDLVGGRQVLEVHRDGSSSAEAPRLPPVPELPVISVGLAGAVYDCERVVELAALALRGHGKMGIQDHIKMTLADGQQFAGLMLLESGGCDGGARKETQREGCGEECDPDQGDAAEHGRSELRGTRVAEQWSDDCEYPEKQERDDGGQRCDLLGDSPQCVEQDGGSEKERGDGRWKPSRERLFEQKGVHVARWRSAFGRRVRCLDHEAL